MAMIVVAGFFDVAEGDRRAYLDSKSVQSANTLQEAGCREYAFSADDANAGRVRLIEFWDSMADLQAHLAKMRTSTPQPSPVAVLASEFHVFEATPTQLPSA
jgi:quinol monooxygenase YgiN